MNEFADLGTIGILLTIITAMGRYILKREDDHAAGMSEAWGMVANLTATVNEMAREIAVGNARKDR